VWMVARRTCEELLFRCRCLASYVLAACVI
jgi:hypothetical protein